MNTSLSERFLQSGIRVACGCVALTVHLIDAGKANTRDSGQSSNKGSGCRRKSTPTQTSISIAMRPASLAASPENIRHDAQRHGPRRRGAKPGATQLHARPGHRSSRGHAQPGPTPSHPAASTCNRRPPAAKPSSNGRRGPGENPKLLAAHWDGYVCLRGNNDVVNARNGRAFLLAPRRIPAQARHAARLRGQRHFGNSARKSTLVCGQNHRQPLCRL